MAVNNTDWQVGLRNINQRANNILDSGQWSDCVFIVGTENRQLTIPAHRLILAMASPVFEAMFYGSMADKENKPIEILDVQPPAFKALLKYIYADEINFTSFDQVCDICYAAKKYMIPPLVEECTKFIWKDLHPGNVCRAYAFVRLFEESQLLEKCMSMIKTMTEDVIRDLTFEEVDIATIKAILSQESLNISELEIWEGIIRWSRQECVRQSMESTPANQRKVMQELLPLFRFLTLSATDFANGPALSNVLTKDECFSLLMNISSPGVTPMVPNFSDNTTPRRPPPPPPPQQSWRSREPSIPSEVEVESQEQLMCNCAGPLSDIFINDQLVDCSLSFSVDRDIRIVGIILPTQLCNLGTLQESSRRFPNTQRQSNHACIHRQSVHTFMRQPPLQVAVNKYPELIYAFLQDCNGSRLTYTHFSASVSLESTMEVLFNRPICIIPNTTYKIVVVLNKMGRYPVYTTHYRVLINDVNFSFEDNSNRESIVKTLIFKCPNRPYPPDQNPHWGGSVDL